MARLPLLLVPLFSALLFATAFIESEAYSTTRKAPYPGQNPEKLTHLHFYYHDQVSGNKPSAVIVATGPTTNSSAGGFGMFVVFDDPMTVGPEVTSKEIGRSQGMYAAADQKQLGLVMTFNLAFTEGKFAGSTVALYGRNQVMSKVRELSIVGGTGAFRFGRGYAQAKTFSLNASTGDAVVEYNVYIWH